MDLLSDDWGVRCGPLSAPAPSFIRHVQIAALLDKLLFISPVTSQAITTCISEIITLCDTKTGSASPEGPFSLRAIGIHIAPHSPLSDHTNGT